VSYLLTLLAWLGGGGTADFAWVPSWGLRFSIEFDGVSAIYGLLATGVGTVVLVYSSVYLPRHLHHHHRNLNEATVFYSLILLFMGAMLGLVMSDDLLLLFIFWDLTAIASYFLIGFDRDEPASRPAALMALLVTGGTAILMLVGVMMLWAQTGTTSIADLAAQAEGGVAFSIAIWLIAIAALAKSAQMPFHFWLPRAMVAPTPVSSYLHSAAMVAAGVFLLERLLPLVHRAAFLPQALLVIGFCSIMIGGVLALSRDDMKRVLAYSTIGQYGYVVVLLGLGGVYGAVGAAMYVLAHAAAKCALFLTAGAVTEATGKKNLSELGGLGRPMPLLAVTSGIAAAAIAALPGTMGFFKDELFFAALHEAGTGFTVLAVLSAALTFAYIARFWGSIFLGELRTVPGELPWLMPAAILVLGRYLRRVWCLGRTGKRAGQCWGECVAL
jgi:multicomponent Na+:H+ antiporter subunit A